MSIQAGDFVSKVNGDHMIVWEVLDIKDEPNGNVRAKIKSSLDLRRTRLRNNTKPVWVDLVELRHVGDPATYQIRVLREHLDHMREYITVLTRCVHSQEAYQDYRGN